MKRKKQPNESGRAKEKHNEMLYGDPKDKEPVTFEEHLARLTPRNQVIVRSTLSGKSPKEAALAAGLSPKSGPHTVMRMLKQPQIMAALAAGRREVSAKAQYGLEEFITELNEVSKFAKDTENATAYARAVELKGKALGLLIERQNIMMNQTVDMTGLLTDASNRIKHLGPAQVVQDALPAPVIPLPKETQEDD